MRKILVSIGLIVFVLSGCANSPTNNASAADDSLPALLNALQKTNDAGSGRMALDVTFTSPQQTVRVTGDVEYVMDPSDPTSLRERVVLDIPSLGMMPAGKVEMIVGKASVIYVRAPMFASFMPADTPWIKLDPSALPGSDAGLGAATGAATAAANPAAILAAIKAALTVQEVGQDVVDGSAATRYRASVDLVKLLPLVADLTPDKPTDADMQKAKDQLAKLGLQTLPIDMWVDEAGFLKRMQLTLDLGTMNPDAPGTSLSVTLSLSDIGGDISIDVPPAAQVTDISDLLSGFAPTTSS